MNHQERKQRRMRIAKDAASGLSTSEVMAKWSVSKSTVQLACKENNVLRPSQKPIPVINRDATDEENATALGVSVGTIKKFRRIAGVQMKRRGRVRREYTEPEWWAYLDSDQTVSENARRIGLPEHRVREAMRKMRERKDTP